MIKTARNSLCGAVLIAVTGTYALALPTTPHEQAEVFAICSGRFEAIATRQKALKMPEAARSKHIKDNFDLLLEATLPAALEFGVPESMPEQWRSGGWVEIAGLLADEQYSFDARRSRLARDAMEKRLDDCRNLIFS